MMAKSGCPKRRIKAATLLMQRFFAYQQDNKTWGFTVPITLRNVVIHGFEKAQHTQIVTECVVKDRVLDVTQAGVIRLVSSVVGLLGQAGHGLSYGQFGDEGREGRFPEAFADFLASDQEAAAFLATSAVAMVELTTAAARQALATGGHILFAYYTNEFGDPYFLTAMIKPHAGVSLDVDYVPIESEQIDLRKVSQAARINVNRYREVVAAANGDDEVEQTYVAFVGKSKDSDASGYFVDALGCTKGIPSSRATDNALSGIRGFFSNADVLRRYRTAAHDSVVQYLQAQMDRKEPASLEGVVHAASSVVPGELVAALTGLSGYLNDEERRVPEAFLVHASTLKKRTSLKADETGWKVQFEQQLLGSTPNSAFYYNEEVGTLTISRLPERFKRKMKDVLRDRAADD